jgi:predicted ribosome quality control (RQC) complex YloA/Tae2 family protein
MGPRLEGARIDQVYGLPRNDLALVLGYSGAPRLWFCTEPDEPHLYERNGPHPTPSRPPAFAMAARKLLSGRRIAGIEEVGEDRVVTLHCGGGSAGSLVFEIIPRRSTAMLVDSNGVVRAVWHRRRSRIRAGEIYAPPDTPPRRDPHELGDEDWRTIEASGDARAISRSLARSLRGMSLLIAKEAAHRYSEGMSLRKAVLHELERAEEEPTAACIYAPLPLDELSELPPRSQFLLAPYELAHVRHLVAVPFSDCMEAAGVFYPLRARLRILQRVRTELGSALEVAAARTTRTLEAVSEDRASLRDPDRYRRWADLLLAHPDVDPEEGPRKSGSGNLAAARVVVPDDYGDGEPIEIPVDPSKSIIENAQTYYRRAKRATRSVGRTRQRQRTLEARSGRISRLHMEIAEVSDLRSAQRMAKRAAAEGAEVKPDRWQEPEALFPSAGHDGLAVVPDEAHVASAGGREQPQDTVPATKGKVAPGISSYTSSDDYEILVGRNAGANDRLTHRMAAPHDWWLHAEGPGSHVVVRNARREEEPPAATLSEAASLAAYFSFARGATKVNVHFTQVRHLRKPKGASPGRVILKLRRTVLAEPLSPKKIFGASGQDPETKTEPPTRSGPGAR